MSFSFSSSSSSLKRSPSIWPEPRRKSRTCSSWTEADEVHLLNAVLEIVKADSPSNEYVSLFDTIQSSLRREYTREQVVDKLKGLKQKFQNHHSSSSSSTPDADAATLNSHQRILFEICEKIWGGWVRQLSTSFNSIIVMMKSEPLTLIWILSY
eukprot:TRINITY_DN46043_c2_g1_i2.p1 TRINITY_DN46043_c2_g1~~TRINITY_DN46043_c2_g1_i2.p1  ORF type:complete len:154 (-),score=27.42 TRINITY_DN46043_c2_g1_i2:222-683(-)